MILCSCLLTQVRSLAAAFVPFESEVVIFGPSKLAEKLAFHLGPLATDVHTLKRGSLVLVGAECRGQTADWHEEMLQYLSGAASLHCRLPAEVKSAIQGLVNGF